MTVIYDCNLKRLNKLNTYKIIYINSLILYKITYINNKDLN
jgi:hypothetical protein